MNIKIHARNIDSKLKIALYAMTEFAMAKLVPSSRIRNNVSINVHLRHHEENGEAMLEDYADRYRPRDFKIIIDHHRAEIDDYDRERTSTEWGHMILRTLAHELVHVKQYLIGDLSWRDKDCYGKVNYTMVNISQTNLRHLMRLRPMVEKKVYWFHSL